MSFSHSDRRWSGCILQELAGHWDLVLNPSLVSRLTIITYLNRTIPCVSINTQADIHKPSRVYRLRVCKRRNEDSSHFTSLFLLGGKRPPPPHISKCISKAMAQLRAVFTKCDVLNGNACLEKKNHSEVPGAYPSWKVSADSAGENDPPDALCHQNERLGFIKLRLIGMAGSGQERAWRLPE